MHHAGNMWSLLNLSEQVDILLHGSTNLNFDSNCAILSEVRLYISHSATFFVILPLAILPLIYCRLQFVLSRGPIQLCNVSLHEPT